MLELSKKSMMAWNKTLKYSMSSVARKSVFGVADLVKHYPGFTATEDG